MGLDAQFVLGGAVLLEFALLLGLGYFLLKLVSAESRLAESREAWLIRLRTQGRRLRLLRRRTERLDDRLPSLEALGGRSRWWLAARMIYKALFVAKVARS